MLPSAGEMACADTSLTPIHRIALQKWLEGATTCPYCRHDVCENVAAQSHATPEHQHFSALPLLPELNFV